MRTKPMLFALCLLLPQLLLAQNDQLRSEPWASLPSSAPDGPDVKTKWRKYAATNAIPMGNLTDEGFQDLQFLREEIGESSLVTMFSNQSGIKEFDDVDTRLTRFMHGEKDFDVLLTLSDLRLLRPEDEFPATTLLRQMMTTSDLQTVSHLRLAQFINTSQKMRVVGLVDNPADPFFAENMEEWLEALDISFGEELYEADNLLSNLARNEPSADFTVKEAMTTYLNAKKAVADMNSELTYDQRSLFVRLFDQRMEWLKFLDEGKGHGKTYGEFRLQLASKNLAWVRKELYPGKKAILIIPAYMRPEGSNSLELLLPDDSYNIYLTAFESESVPEEGEPILVPKAQENSLEAMMRSTRFKYGYLNLKRDKVLIQMSAEGDKDKSYFPIPKTDALIFVNTASPSKPLFKAKTR